MAWFQTMFSTRTSLFRRFDGGRAVGIRLAVFAGVARRFPRRWSLGPGRGGPADGREAAARRRVAIAPWLRQFKSKPYSKKVKR